MFIMVLLCRLIPKELTCLTVLLLLQLRYLSEACRKGPWWKVTFWLDWMSMQGSSLWIIQFAFNHRVATHTRALLRAGEKIECCMNQSWFSLLSCVQHLGYAHKMVNVVIWKFSSQRECMPDMNPVPCTDQVTVGVSFWTDIQTDKRETVYPHWDHFMSFYVGDGAWKCFQWVRRVRRNTYIIGALLTQDTMYQRHC